MKAELSVQHTAKRIPYCVLRMAIEKKYGPIWGGCNAREIQTPLGQRAAGRMAQIEQLLLPLKSSQ